MAGMLISHQLVILFLMVFSSFYVLGGPCESDQVMCKDSGRCVRISYICDGDNDCGDSTDESFCKEWKSSGCSDKGMASCERNGVRSCIRIEDYCSASPPCSGIVDPRICVMMNNRVIQRISNIIIEEPTTTVTPTPLPEPNNLEMSELQGEMFGEALNKTFRHAECPTLYTRVGDDCVSFFYVLKLGWGEARQFCELIGGQLMSFADDNGKFISIFKHLRENGITSDFWIGGRYVNDTEGWTWLPETSMELGSPFWAVRHEDSCIQRTGEYNLATQYLVNKTACYHYQQAPRPDATDLCAALTYKYYHFMTDENCLSLKSPLCIADNNGTDIYTA